MTTSAEPNPKSSILQRSWILRFARWLTWARALRLVLVAVTAVVLFYVEEKVRGKWAWNRCQAELARQGVSLDFQGTFPPPLAAEKNLARCPALEPLFIIVREQWVQVHEMTNHQAAAQEYWKKIAEQVKHREVAQQKGYFNFPGGFGSWRTATLNDPKRILGDYVQTSKGPAGKIKAPPPAATPEEAAQLILEIFNQSTGAILNQLAAESQVRPLAVFEFPAVSSLEPFEIMLPHLAQFKILGAQASARALAELYLRQSDNGFRDTMLTLRLSEALQQEPFLISFLVSLSLREEAIDAAWYGLATRQWNEAQLAQIQQRFESLEVMGYARRVMDNERIGVQAQINWIAGHFPGKQVLSDYEDLLDPFYYTKKNQDKSREAWLSNLYPKGWFYFESVNWQHQMLAAIRAFGAKSIREAEARLSTVGESSMFARILQHQYFASIMLPRYRDCLLKAVNLHAANSLAATACALERYRLEHQAYPRDLAGLVPKYLRQLPIDVCSGEPLKYQLQEKDSFLLYSIGLNGVDDGGRVAFHQRVINLEQGDWVWKPTVEQ